MGSGMPLWRVLPPGVGGARGGRSRGRFGRRNCSFLLHGVVPFQVVEQRLQCWKFNEEPDKELNQELAGKSQFLVAPDCARSG